MASNSIFDSFSNYSSNLLRGLMEKCHNGILTTDIHYQVKLFALSLGEYELTAPCDRALYWNMAIQ
ncbi:Hypothetical protein SMAX5B_003432 [Scophthalmus maximus]|uniref:Uncharacterized protein n=1 Tax=Scophthalmus maximus TaxID=52904 RepID=A0A2U9CJH9_SCOMX|nr:Hypothetical protein SMAX5B_003432 [Scophthalmus maximus]